jgi:hypothetical protein
MNLGNTTPEHVQKLSENLKTKQAAISMVYQQKWLNSLVLRFPYHLPIFST